jgi:DNA-binding GntR family transcriptional regulator
VALNNQFFQPRKAKISSLADQVYEFVRASIIRGELPEGEKLVELDIASQMGTSQGPVREALQRLERDGLVERRARSATYVTSISLDEVYELFSIRSVIEGFAVQRTAQKITSDQCENLAELIQKMAQAGAQQEIIKLAEYDLQFHQCLVEWSGNTSLLRVWRPLSSQIERFIVHSHPTHYPDFVEIGTRHQPIIDALRQHDGDLASRIVREHIMLIWSRIHP